MTTYIIRRILLGLLVVLLVSMLIFTVMHLLPGDPILLYVGAEMSFYSQEQMDLLRTKYGLDKPLPTQYFLWIGGLFQGDLGYSIPNQMDVNRVVIQRLPVTFNLGIISFFFAATLGITFGTICAIRRGKWPDTLFSALGNLGITVPEFWIGIMLIYFLSYKLNLFPTFGYVWIFDDLAGNLHSLVLPAFCLAIRGMAGITRQTRSSVLEVTRQDYIRTAWAKGFRERYIVTRHILRNGLIPVVTAMGMQVSIMFGGSVLVEAVFNIPGMGRMLRDGVLTMDYQVVQAGILIIAICIVAVNLVVDIIYGWLDPRIRYN